MVVLPRRVPPGLVLLSYLHTDVDFGYSLNVLGIGVGIGIVRTNVNIVIDVSYGIVLFRLLTYPRIAKKDGHFRTSPSRGVNTTMYGYVEVNFMPVYPARFRDIDLSSIRSSFSSPESFLASSPTLYPIIFSPHKFFWPPGFVGI